MKLKWMLAGLWGLTGCALPEAAVKPEETGTSLSVAPIVIAHRGASGALPEHTLEAYALAIELGADFIEPDLVMTKDGALIARHDRYLSSTTDVADHPEFADRKRVQSGFGGERDDWWAEDFTLAEIQTLRARQPFPGRSTAHDDLYRVPRFEDVVALAKAEGVGLYPETKSPGHHTAIGLDMKAPLLDALEGFDGPVFVQSFEATILRELDRLSDVALVQLYSGHPLAAEAGFEPPLDAVATYADGVGPSKHLLWTETGEASGFVTRAHALGLVLHPWTYRDDAVGPGYDSIEDELAAAMAQGIDGFFTDFPATGVAVRDQN